MYDRRVLRKKSPYSELFSSNAEKCRKNADQNNSEYGLFYAVECSECAPKSFLASKLTENETLNSSESQDSKGDFQDVEYYKWCQVDGKVQKVLINVIENDAVTDWVSRIENLKLHIRRKRT